MPGRTKAAVDFLLREDSADAALGGSPTVEYLRALKEVHVA
jgi:hypothetical protein